MVYKQLVLLLLLSTTCCAIQTQSLNEKWTLKGPKSINIDATVPGSVFSDLMSAEIISDIFAPHQERNFSWVGKTRWTYQTTFLIEKKLLKHQTVFLVFEGLDTFAEVSVNKIHVGKTSNMFVRYIFSIKDQLKVGANTLSVYFDSTVAKVKVPVTDESFKHVENPNCLPVDYNGLTYDNRIRKMQATFSWDMGQEFASAGIWKNVYLQAFDNVVIDYVVVRTIKSPNHHTWTLNITTYLNTSQFANITGSLNVTLYLKDSVKNTNIDLTLSSKYQRRKSINTLLTVSSDLIEVWWPNGYGSQNLYNLTVVFVSHTERAEKSLKIGFRTVEIVEEELNTGKTFYVKVNDKAIFAKGASVIPLYVLPEVGQDPETIRFLLQSARDVNMNMLRVWGGGTYESDYFYDLADEYGLLIWHDLMFACGTFVNEDPYLSDIRIEIRQQLKRLASHPSMVLFYGINENRNAQRNGSFRAKSHVDQFQRDYVRSYAKLIKEEFSQIMPNIPFIILDNGLHSTQEKWKWGHAQFYNYVSDSWDPKTFPIPRFASEYGYQSMPSLESWNTVGATVDDLRPENFFLASRQHHPLVNIQNIELIKWQFHLPESSKTNYVNAFIYFSQIIQAQAIKTESEHYRSFKGRLNWDGEGYTMGALYFQLNDVWVAPTWSGIDFNRRWKMLHYKAREFFSPAIVTGRLTRDNRLQVFAVLDDLQVRYFGITFILNVYRWDSFDPHTDVQLPVTLNTDTAVLLTTLDVMTAFIMAGCGKEYLECIQNCFFYLRLVDSNDTEIAPPNYVFPKTLKYAALVDANVQIFLVTQTDKIGLEYDVEIQTDAIALFVWLDSHEIIGRFSENGFLLVSPTKTVHFTAENPVTQQYFEQSLTVTHVRDNEYW